MANDDCFAIFYMHTFEKGTKVRFFGDPVTVITESVFTAPLQLYDPAGTGNGITLLPPFLHNGHPVRRQKQVMMCKPGDLLNS